MKSDISNIFDVKDVDLESFCNASELDYEFVNKYVEKVTMFELFFYG